MFIFQPHPPNFFADVHIIGRVPNANEEKLDDLQNFVFSNIYAIAWNGDCIIFFNFPFYCCRHFTSFSRRSRH